jgi:AcrR family transcriptional regulator
MRERKTSRTQAQRTEETRQKLVDAAKTVFARYGFEAATIEDIAAKAGYTRGAFYCNFKSKEDIFIKCMERVLGQWSPEFEKLSQTYRDPCDRLAGLQELYTRIMASDDATKLLLLEFKFYAVRHPKRHAKLAAAYARVRQAREHLLEKTASELGLKLPVSADILETAFAALIAGLALDRAFYVQEYRPAPVEFETIVSVFFDRVVNYRDDRRTAE